MSAIAASPGEVQRLDQRVHAATVEVAPGCPLELLDRLVADDGTPVGPWFAHCAERIRGGDDAGAERDRRAAEPVRIATAVPALVVPANDAQDAGLTLVGAEQRLSQHGMETDCLPLGGGE